MFTIKIDMRRVDLALVRAPAALKAELADGMDHIQRRFMKRLYQQRLSGPPGIKARPRGIFRWFKRKVSGVDLGASRYQSETVASIIAAPGSVQDMVMEIYTKSPVAKMHEFGGTITAPPGRMFPIPLKNILYMFRQSGFLKEHYKLKNLRPKLRPLRLKGGLYLAQITKEREVKPYYILKNKITMKPRLGFYKLWDSMELDRITILNDAINKALDSI